MAALTTSAITGEDVVRESECFSCNEIYVYKVPPLRTHNGHRAEDWGLANPLLKSSMKIVNRNDVLLIKMFADKENEEGPKGSKTEVRSKMSTSHFNYETTPNTILHHHQVLFATAPIDLPSDATKRMDQFVENCVDSSRYFVVKCVNGSRHVFFGIGFRERNDSLDFKSCLQDYASSIERERQAKELMGNINIGTTPLKEGEKITINIGVGGGRPRKPKQSSSNGVGAGGILLRKPPPPAPSPVTANNTATKTIVGETNGDDDWGDFEEA